MGGRECPPKYFLTEPSRCNSESSRTRGRSSRCCHRDFSSLGAAGYGGGYLAVGNELERSGFHSESYFRGLREAGPIDGDDGSDLATGWGEAANRWRHFELLEAVQVAAGADNRDRAGFRPAWDLDG